MEKDGMEKDIIEKVKMIQKLKKEMERKKNMKKISFLILKIQILWK